MHPRPPVSPPRPDSISFCSSPTFQHSNLATCQRCSNSLTTFPSRIVTPSPTPPPRKSFCRNTYESARKCCKQKTYSKPNSFKCNTYKKPRAHCFHRVLRASRRGGLSICLPRSFLALFTLCTKSVSQLFSIQALPHSFSKQPGCVPLFFPIVELGPPLHLPRACPTGSGPSQSGVVPNLPTFQPANFPEHLPERPIATPEGDAILNLAFSRCPRE
jgi:hypothetical protein